jgi:hypothetical protein
MKRYVFALCALISIASTCWGTDVKTIDLQTALNKWWKVITTQGANPDYFAMRIASVDQEGDNANFTGRIKFRHAGTTYSGTTDSFTGRCYQTVGTLDDHRILSFEGTGNVTKEGTGTGPEELEVKVDGWLVYITVDTGTGEDTTQQKRILVRYAAYVPSSRNPEPIPDNGRRAGDLDDQGCIVDPPLSLRCAIQGLKASGDPCNPDEEILVEGNLP